MNGARGLAYTEDRGFKVTEILRTDTTGCWNEMETRDFVNDSVILNTAAERWRRCTRWHWLFPRKVGDREQSYDSWGCGLYQ